MWALGLVLYFIASKGNHLFQSAFEVGAWRGGNPLGLDRTIYSFDLRLLISDLLRPKPELRPTAEQVTCETEKNNRQAYDQA